MTDPITATIGIGTGVVTCVVAAWAVIDPSITNIILALIPAAVVVLTLWFKYKTDALNAKLKEQDVKIEEVKKTSDGMKDALVKSTAEANLAKGIAEGKHEATAVAAATLAAAAEAATALTDAAKVTADATLAAAAEAATKANSKPNTP